MKENIERIRSEIAAGIEAVKGGTRQELFELKMKYLGKTGEISALSKGMRDVPAEERPAMGKLVSEVRAWAEEQFSATEELLKQKELEARYKSERVDVTMPARFAETGTLHPVSIVKKEIIECFAGLGFEIYEGPEIEKDYYNFQALNIPADHPARDMQDTFFITGEYLLRSQTSSGQIRVMENKKPPIKVLSPGRVYRSDSDATHSPMFHQMEGLVVDKGITLCDLKGLLDEFARRMFTSETKTRLRPSYFPFTEPSVEVDLSCHNCGGKGCRICKGTGWIEILGAGVVNRLVLENCGIDPDVYTGFAFGMGLERIAMIKYGVNDMRYLFENDVRLLKQFKD